MALGSFIIVGTERCPETVGRIADLSL